MHRHAGRAALASVERAASQLKAFPSEGSLVAAVRRIVDAQRTET